MSDAMNRIGRALGVAMCASFLCLLAEVGPAHASARGETNAGNDLFRQGKYADARARYLAAQADLPDAPELDLNLGAALYQEGRYEDALRSFFALPKKEKATPALSGAAAYDAGNALFKLGRYDEAIEAYKHALRTNPEDIDAKHNLELAQRMKQEQQKQEEQQEQENEQGNEGKKNENEEQKSDQGQGSEQDSSKSDSNDQQQGDQSKEDEKKNESGEQKQEQQGKNESEQQQQQQGQQGEQNQPQQGRPEQGEGQGATGQQGPVPEGGISREDAMRFLEALEASEMQRAREEDEKALLQRLLDEGRDW